MKVKSLKHLVELANQKRSVSCPLWRRPYPAAWVMNWQGFRIHLAIEAGMRIYKPKPIAKNYGQAK